MATAVDVVSIQEAEGTFPTDDATGAIVFDRASLGRGRTGPPSIATTELASAAGLVVVPSRDAFLKSFTFMKKQRVEAEERESEDQEPPEDDLEWGISLSNQSDAPALL
jgi:hypothetical protein